MREAAISGARATSGLLGKLPLSGETKLFQLKLGDGQHAFCAHGQSQTRPMSRADRTGTRGRLTRQLGRVPRSDGKHVQNESLAGRDQGSS
jgi:hypothetical protein